MSGGQCGTDALEIWCGVSSEAPAHEDGTHTRFLSRLTVFGSVGALMLTRIPLPTNLRTDSLPLIFDHTLSLNRSTAAGCGVNVC